ncbi:MAG TPA: response regulator, partial [Puia sp.]
LSKIEAGRMNLEYGFLDVRQMTGVIKSLFEPLAKEKKLDFKITIGPAVPEEIETDRMRVEQVLKNLLSNAFKFTTEGSVELQVKPDPGNDPRFIVFEVKDTGIGIPDSKQALIFEAFQQADGSTKRKFGGTGLGLSISRELSKLLNGDLSVSSEENKGSVFSFRLPVSRLFFPAKEEKHPAGSFEEMNPPATAPVSPEPPLTVTDIPKDIPDDREFILPGDKVILIVEDDTHFARALLDFTRDQGYKGIVAVRGDVGIQLAKTFNPRGILLDIQLPVQNGWEVMEELKRDPKTRHIPVHIMSSFEARKESLQKGAVDFTSKPVAFEKMQEIFKKIELTLKGEAPSKVLIVEENAKHARALSYYLGTYGIQPKIAESVEETIKIFHENKVDCVILAMGVSDMSGYEKLEAVKAAPDLGNIPIILFTGKSFSRSEEKRIRQYADSIVIKTAHSYERMLDEVSIFLHIVDQKDRPRESPPMEKLGALDEVLKDNTALIADDDVRNIFSLTKVLEQHKMKVIPAIDGKEALEMLELNPQVNIILMDMMMPEMDGYESIRKIRKIPAFRNLPIIAVTAKAMVGDREKCISAGASDYISKPIDIDQLISLLRIWLYE